MSTQHVKGHYREDGTYVKPHVRQGKNVPATAEPDVTGTQFAVGDPIAASHSPFQHEFEQNEPFEISSPSSLELEIPETYTNRITIKKGNVHVKGDANCEFDLHGQSQFFTDGTVRKVTLHDETAADVKGFTEVVAYGKSHVSAHGDSKVRLTENATGSGYERAELHAHDNAEMTLKGTARGHLSGRSYAKLHDNASIGYMDHYSAATLHDYCVATNVRGHANVELRDESVAMVTSEFAHIQAKDRSYAETPSGTDVEIHNDAVHKIRR